MYEYLARQISILKRILARDNSGSAHMQEILPIRASDLFPVDAEHLDMLHQFAEKNPLYHNSFRREMAGVECVIYEGDINEYWLGSIKHGSSCQPFYPTWLVSAFILAGVAKNTFECTELVDIGSGDGRIAFCGRLLEMSSYSIEIDDSLAGLQMTLRESTKTDFEPMCADALQVDYDTMDLSRPAFFVGGLPQMGGDMLADDLMCKIRNMTHDCVVVLAGAGMQSGPAVQGNVDARRHGGWAPLVEKHGLEVLYTVNLPTMWTFDQLEDTPYIYVARSRQRSSSSQ